MYAGNPSVMIYHLISLQLYLYCWYRIVRSDPIRCQRDGMRQGAERNWIKSIWRRWTTCLALCGMRSSFSQTGQSFPIATSLGLSNACCKTVMTGLMVIFTIYTRRSSCTFHLCFMACIACCSELGCLGHCLSNRYMIYDNSRFLYFPIAN